MAQENVNNTPLPEGTPEVKPQEPVKVYATDKLAATHAAGEEMIIHRALAEKMIASGKVTKSAPKKAIETAKEDKAAK